MSGFQYWPHQEYAISTGIAKMESGVKSFCITSCTGGGKTRIVQGLLEHIVNCGKRAALFTNRKLLTNQLARGLSNAGIHLGVRAAEFEAWTDLNAPVQICSTPTEVARVLGRRKKAMDRLMSEEEAHSTFTLFPADVIIIDELHMNASTRMQHILAEYREKYDSTIIGITATPLGVNHICSELIVAGNMTSLRACGALVPAMCFQPTVWDLSKVYRAKHELPSQESMEAATRAIWTQHVVGSIYTHWKKINADGKPTIAFAPGVKESLGMAQEFASHGVKVAHISGEGMWVDGKEYKGASQEDRDEVFARSKDGNIQVIWNRFVLREAIDLPWLECLILACPIASLLSFVQTVGRVLRASPSTGKTGAKIIDHAGSIELHGSPNMDRDRQWIEYFNEDADKITKDRVNTLRDPESDEPAPITCPKCGSMRRSGPKCINPACGFEHSESVRYILQEHGELVATKESFMPKRKPKMKPDTAQLWERCYWRCKKAKTPRSFNQVRALFIHEYGYSPPQGLPLMPTQNVDWSRKVNDVPFHLLVQKPRNVPTGGSVPTGTDRRLPGME